MRDTVQTWKTLATKILFSHDKLGIVEDTVLLPDGTNTTYLRHSPAQHHSVIIIALNAKNQVLAQREYSHPPQRVMWQLPGGSMQHDETTETAALRELAEESGYTAEQVIPLGSFFTHNRLSDQRQYVLLCRQLSEYKLPQDPDEFIETHWRSRAKLQQMIARQEIENINMLAALNLWFQYEMNNQEAD